jgi:CBS domain-containing membrane protein
MLAIGVAAAVTKRPFIFPSLGPSAIMLFASPLDKNSAPRHVIVGHLIGAAAGYVALAMTGLLAVPFSTQIGPHRVLAAAIALGLTAGALSLAKTEHAPAGATTLIVALGILPRLVDFVFLMVAVIVLTIAALIVNRVFGIPYPLWNEATLPAPPPPVS